ncbi:MAG: alanine--tRNA ligase [Acidimicrobiia bacterium]
MDSNQIRRTYLDFFAERGHTVVPSASLIPIDPTLLLTNAGMVPFKPYMLGEETPPYLRAATVQKVARTIDIDIVGTTARHLTFFEMLGNFSFGDYFKEKAIPWAYELVTEGFGLDPERLWYTVHITDDDAAAIWIDEVGVPADRVQRLDKDNFWQMGVPGPCGPSSEIFYDKGPEYGKDGGPAVDDERNVEVWNLVFMQNIQDEPYHVVGDLPARNIDTGAGLERIATVLQGVDTIFETDVIRPMVATSERATGATYGDAERTDVSLRIMADHGRAVTFLIGDKVVPSNEGRGYVLRRLIRRAVRHAFLLGSEDLIMPKLVETTADVMREPYPDLYAQRSGIVEMVAREEEQFRRTLRSGHQLLDEELRDLEPGAVLSGETAFKLHDTFGFPKELTEEIVSERGFAVDLNEFDEMMDSQRERARAAYKGADAAARADAYRTLLSGVETTEFTGYESEQGLGRILSIVSEGETIEKAEEGREIELFVDRTPFYAESGGQVGDSGLIVTPTGTVAVSDTQFAVPGLHGHRGVVTSGSVQLGQDADLTISHERRERIRKNHTGTHILHWALREVVGEHVHQAGSLVSDDRLRFDFSHYQGMSIEQMREVELVANERVIENAAVVTLETSKNEAEKMGALAFFGDKYGDDVRVVQTGDYSTEFCGGTHVPTTGQIGPLIVTSEGSVAANTRRIDAVTGTAGYEYLSALRNDLERTETALGAQPGHVVEAAQALVLRSREQEERIEQFEQQSRSEAARTLIEQMEEHHGYNVLVAKQEGLTGDGLRALAFQIRDRLGSGIGVLGSVSEGKGGLIAFVSDDLVEAGVSAGELIAPAARVLGGGGSRDPRLSQAGGPHGDRLDEALEVALAAAREAVVES